MDHIIGHHRKVNSIVFDDSANILIGQRDFPPTPHTIVAYQSVSSQFCKSFAGHVDPGEDDFTTALRETREEAGYTIDDLKIYEEQSKTLIYKVKGQRKEVIYWLAEIANVDKDPILSDEHTEFRWLTKDAAIQLSGYSDFAAMVNDFHGRIGQL